MAEYLSAEYFAELRAREQRPGNHKAEWTEAAVRELELLALRKGTDRHDWHQIINLLEVEPRESAPAEAGGLPRSRGRAPRQWRRDRVSLCGCAVQLFASLRCAI